MLGRIQLPAVTLFPDIHSSERVEKLTGPSETGSDTVFEQRLN